MNQVSRDRSLRAPVALLAFFALLMALVLVGQSLAGAADKKKAPRAAVAVKTKGQAALLDKGKLAVKVRSKGAKRVRVKATYKGRSKPFKARTVKFKRKRGRKTVSLRLSKTGKQSLGACGSKRVKITGKYRSKGKRKRATDKVTLRRDASRCEYKPVPLENADRCDFLDPAVCLQPWPNDYFTKNDPSTPTGKRLNLHPESTPANKSDVHVDPTDFNRADGFSPGNQIIVKIPEVETPAAFENSGMVPITNLRAYDDPNQAVIVIDAETGERHPIWAEIDANPTTVSPSEEGPGGIGQNPTNTGDVNLIIRPAVNWEFEHRYIVALRNLRDANNQPVQAPIGFRVYRDNDITDQPEVEQRRPHMESVIDTLTDQAGVQRDSLYMAWDFTVASQESVTGRATTIRDDAFERLGDINLADRIIQGDSPEWTITSSTPNPNANTAFRVEGTIDDIPCYLDQDGCPTGSQFAHAANGDVTWNTGFTTDVPFRCTVPKSVETDNPGQITPGVPGLYGHGLLGNRGQVNGQEQLANRSNTIWCAMDWQGFSDADLIPTVATAMQDMSNFKKLADRMQQGFVNFMYLGRALAHPDGLATDPDFQLDAGSGDESVIDTSDDVNQRINYMGISQGAIMGGALTALLPDADRGVLNVTGMNYSTLLRRSVDSDEYFQLPTFGLYENYPNELERPLLLSMVQLLWDRGEANGYAHNTTTEPLPNTPEHEVLLQAALGDHQVANITAEVQARTYGADLYAPALEPGRHWEDDPYMDLNEVPVAPGSPYTEGSMLVYYDGGPIGWEGPDGGGTPTPPDENVPPWPEWGFGDDPHGYPRRAEDGMNQVESFLAGNGIPRCADPDGYCFSNGWTGAP